VTADSLDGDFEAYLSRDDDAIAGGQFFEILAEIERRRAREPLEVTLRVVNGQAQFDPSSQARAEGNSLWVGDQRVIVKLAE